MFEESSSIYIGVAVIIFIFCIFLVIFAPKSQNFFNKDKYTPEIDSLAKSEDFFNIMKSTETKFSESAGLDEETPTLIKWEKWPDNTITSGNVELLPIFMFSTINKANSKTFAELVDIVKVIPEIQSIYFIRLDSNSKFVKHSGYAELVNKSLRYIYCLNADCYNEDQCGLWVNSEAKKMTRGESYIYDASKEHSLYNNTITPVIFFVVDFDRPLDVPFGYSEYVLTNKMKKMFIDIC